MSLARTHRSRRILSCSVVAGAAIALFIIQREGIPYPVIEKRWSIGIYAGASPLDLHAVDGVRNPVLSGRDVTDIPAHSVADPFITRHNSIWYMFFEVVDARNGRGTIGVATSEDARRWRYGGIVLAEPFHLSYPYVFSFNDVFYMIPETGEERAIRLYKAEAFPTRWTFVRTLLSGSAFSDSSIIQYQGRWFILTETHPYVNDTLALYDADNLEGPWGEHPKSPIVKHNRHISRPAGRLVVLDGKVYRFAQDDAPSYGTQVFAFEITKLTAADYEERPAREEPILKPGDDGWNRNGMHQVDPHQVDANTWIACVDGWRRSWGLAFYHWH
jgi:hypothetical protein